ncbi:MAG: DUF6542 domain-containing protein [Mycobacteriales bacterium]
MTISAERGGEYHRDPMVNAPAGYENLPTQKAERGVHGLVASLVILVIAGIGGAVDSMTGDGLRTVFAVCLVVGVVIAGLVVRRSDVLYIVFAPPLVTVMLALVTVLTTSKSAFDLLASYLSNGFPPIAIASAVGALIAGIRLIFR